MIARIAETVHHAYTPPALPFHSAAESEGYGSSTHFSGDDYISAAFRKGLREAPRPAEQPATPQRPRKKSSKELAKHRRRLLAESAKTNPASAPTLASGEAAHSAAGAQRGNAASGSGVQTQDAPLESSLNASDLESVADKATAVSPAVTKSFQDILNDISRAGAPRPAAAHPDQTDLQDAPVQKPEAPQNQTNTGTAPRDPSMNGIPELLGANAASVPPKNATKNSDAKADEAAKRASSAGYKFSDSDIAAMVIGSATAGGALALGVKAALSRYLARIAARSTRAEATTELVDVARSAPPSHDPVWQ